MRRYAFIVGIKSLPDPFLVEISRRTKTTAEQVAFFREDVIHCHAAASRTVRCIIEDPYIFCMHRQEAKDAVVTVLRNEVGGCQDPAAFQEEVIRLIVEKKIVASFQQKKKTRGLCLQHRQVLFWWTKIHRGRIAAELHLGAPLFGVNLRRSIGELIFVVGSNPLHRSIKTNTSKQRIANILQVRQNK